MAKYREESAKERIHPPVRECLTLAVTLLILMISILQLGCLAERSESLPATKGVAMKPADDFVEGGVYSVESGEGDFSVAKVLVVDDKAVHVRLYKNKYPARPGAVDLKTLSLGSIDDPEGFGMGHLPLSREGFAAWKPELIAKDKVGKDELEGYEMWKEAGGEVFP